MNTGEDFSKKESTIGVYGSITVNKDIEIKPDYPSNTTLTISKGSWFSVTGTEVRAYLKGKFSIADGKFMWLLGGTSFPTTLNYTYSDARNLLLKLTPDADYKQYWNKGGSVYSELKEQEAWAVLGDATFTNGPHVQGLVYPDLRVDYKFPNKTAGYCSFKNAVNYGKGFCLDDNGTIDSDAKFNGFKTDMKTVHIKMTNGKLYSLEAKEKVQIPFFNANPIIRTAWSYDGFAFQTVDVDYTKCTVYDNGTDKITAIIYEGTFKNDLFLCSATFDITNKDEKNVEAVGMFSTKVEVSANGKTETDGFLVSPLEYQVAGKLNGFDYNIGLFTISTVSNTGKYKFELSGKLVMEQATLSVKTNIAVNYTFDARPYHEYPENISTQIDPSLTVCNDPSFGTEAPVIAIPGDNSLEVKSGKVKAAFSSGSMDFEGWFEVYNGDATFGDGFAAQFSVDMYTPMQGEMMSKIMVGKTGSYKYWYVEALQKDFITMPTGILDLEIYGFGGRIYYHMIHAGGGSIDNNNYIPSKSTSLGLYGIAYVRNAATKGNILWGSLSTEIFFSGVTPYKINLFGNTYLLSSGSGSTDGKVHGTADFQMDIKPERKLHGTVVVNGNLYDMVEVHLGLDLLVSNSEWHLYLGTPQAPMYVHCIPINKDMNGYFGILKKNGQVTVSGGVSGTIFGVHAGDCVDLYACDGCYGADVTLAGSANASAMFPSFQMNGGFNISGSAEAYCTLCGVGPSPSISATFAGDFHVPSPFIMHGNLTIHTPKFFPNICCDATYNNGSFSVGADCD